MESLTSAAVAHPRVVCGIDTGRLAGWSIFVDGELAESGVFEVYKQAKTKAPDGKRLTAFYNHLVQLRLKYDIGLIAFEQISGGSAGAQIAMSNMYRAMLAFFCETRRIPLVGLAPTSIKKLLTGSGKGKKDGVMAELRRRGYAFCDDNEADSIAVSLSLLKLLVDEPPKPVAKSKKKAKKVAASGKPQPRRKASKRKHTLSSRKPRGQRVDILHATNRGGAAGVEPVRKGRRKNASRG